MSNKEPKKKRSKKSSYYHYELRVIEHIANFMKLNYIYYTKELLFFVVLDGFPLFFPSLINNGLDQKSKSKKKSIILIPIMFMGYLIPILFLGIPLRNLNFL